VWDWSVSGGGHRGVKGGAGEKRAVKTNNKNNNIIIIIICHSVLYTQRKTFQQIGQI
jgi:hypothetical protein